MTCNPYMPGKSVEITKSDGTKGYLKGHHCKEVGTRRKRTWQTVSGAFRKKGDLQGLLFQKCLSIGAGPAKFDENAFYLPNCFA